MHKNKFTKNLAKILFLLICFFSTPLTAQSSTTSHQLKLYFDENALEISSNIFYIRLENNLIETNVIRTDSQGLYIFEEDIINREAIREKKWKCPYCGYWWLFGKQCKNEKCPTNRW